MWELIVSELTSAMHELARSFAHFVPRLLVMLIIVVLGWLVAYLLKWLVQGILRLAKFDRLSQNSGASQLLTRAALPSSTELLGRFVFWMAWLGFVLVGISVLGVVGFDEQLARFLVFVPRMIVAVLLFFFGLLAASFFSRAVLLWGVNTNLPSARLVSVTVRVLIIIFTLSMVSEELGVAENTMLIAFASVFGALLLGLAIAFGLGGQHMARHMLERRFQRQERPEEEREDELSPL